MAIDSLRKGTEPILPTTSGPPPVVLAAKDSLGMKTGPVFVPLWPVRRYDRRPSRRPSSRVPVGHVLRVGPLAEVSGVHARRVVAPRARVERLLPRFERSPELHLQRDAVRADALPASSDATVAVPVALANPRVAGVGAPAPIYQRLERPSSCTLVHRRPPDSGLTTEPGRLRRRGLLSFRRVA